MDVVTVERSIYHAMPCLGVVMLGEEEDEEEEEEEEEVIGWRDLRYAAAKRVTQPSSLRRPGSWYFPSCKIVKELLNSKSN